MNQLLNKIGNTSIIKLKNNINDNINIYAKLECENLTGSIKDRAVYNIISNYYAQGRITKDTTIIEYTSGNTGISLAMMSQIFKNRVIIVMPNTMSLERRKLIRKYGGELVLVNGGMKESKEKAFELLKTINNSILLDQFNSPYNYMAHYKTASEIIAQLPSVDAIVIGIGTGGTIMGISKYLKEHGHNTKIIGVEPEESPLISKGISAPHGIQGIGANFFPPLLSKDNIDDIILVSTSDAIRYQKILNDNNNINVGISSGAAYFGAIKCAEKYGFKNIVIICPDSGDRYL